MDTNELYPAAVERAEPLVILPGVLCDSRMFSAQRAAFGGVTIDGFYGDADRIGLMADYVIDRMPGRVALLGHSMGARVAIEVWRRAPERVARLALADTGMHPVRPGEAEKRRALVDLGEREGAVALVDAWLPPMIGPAHRSDPALLASLRAMAIDAGPRVFARHMEALLHRPETASLLSSIDCPTFAIVGRDDEWSPVDQHREIAAAIPGAQLRVIGNAGHMAPAEEPVRFNEILREWLSWPARRHHPQDAMER